MIQSWWDRSWSGLCEPDRSTRAYWKTQPTPVASGPSSVFTPSGSRAWIFDRYSITRDRAQ